MKESKDLGWWQGLWSCESARPSFVQAAQPTEAIPLYESFIKALRSRKVKVETGEFGANMQVELVNDGPVTLIFEK